MDPLTFSEDVERRRRLLPMALSQSPGGTLSNAVQPGQSLPMSMRSRLGKVYQELDALESQDVDTSALQALARQQGEQGQSAMLNALAAQFAGESFQPVQAQFLKRAAAAQEPMKIGGGMLTPAGEFIKDPFASRDSRRGSLERQATTLQAMIDRQEKDARDREDRLSRDRELKDYRDRSLAIQATSVGNAGNKAPSGYQWTTAPDGSPTLTFIPGGPADPATKAAGAPTEDERKAAGWFFQADNALRNMDLIMRNSPGAANARVSERIAGFVPGVGQDLANLLRPEERQRFLQAAESMSEALLRAATGAAITKQETDQKLRELIPQIGDQAGTIDQKLASYKVYMDSLRSRAGRALPAGSGASPAAGGNNDPLGLRR